MGHKVVDNPDAQAIPLSAYYFWRYRSPYRYPWARQYLNSDFLSYERHQIDTVSKWYKSFQKSAQGETLPEIRLYSVPPVLNASWKAAINLYGDYAYTGFSALFNSPQQSIIGLFEMDSEIPKDYMFVRIIDARTDHIINLKMNDCLKVIIIDEWEYLDSIKIYQDIDFENRIISMLINDKLIGDPNIADCLQAPILSSPFVQGRGGGITLSSFASRSKFAIEFSNTMSMMVPPECRPNQYIIPKNVSKGHSHHLVPGISLRLAERPCLASDLLSSRASTSYNSYRNELRIREGHFGEYSICSTLNIPNSDPSSSLKILWTHFPEAVVALPYNVDDFVEHDVDLFKFQKILDEDIWLQVVHSHQINPRDDEASLKSRNESLASLRRDFDVQLSDIHEDDDLRNQAIDTLISTENIIRMAQTFARSNDRDTMSVEDYNSANRVILHNFEGFIQNEDVAKIIKGVEGKKRSKRYDVVQSLLIYHNGLTLRELYSQVDSMGLFKDIDDLQRLLDWLYGKGLVCVTPRNEYQWIK